MATLTVTVNYPDNIQIELRDTLAVAWNYTEQVPNPQFNSALPENPTTNPRLINNPQSKSSFIQNYLNDQLKIFIKNSYKEGKEKILNADIQLS
jgi:hypothetical protein